MEESKKSQISHEILKYPYYGNYLEEKTLLSEKIESKVYNLYVKNLIGFRKLLPMKNKNKKLVALLELLRILSPTRSIITNKAIGVTFLQPTRTEIVRSYSNISKQTVITEALTRYNLKSDKIIFNEIQIDQLYNIAVKCQNSYMTREDVILELRAVDFKTLKSLQQPFVL